MDVAGLALSAAQTLLAALQCPEIRSILEYKSQLDDLQLTVQTLESVLRDVAEIKLDLLSNQDKFQINELKDAVYEADDLFDEFVALAQQKQLLNAEGRVSEKVRNFLSLSSNPLSLAYRMSSGVKNIKKKLDAIAYNKQFSFQHDPQPIKNRRPDTCSYVNDIEIIGREDDLEKIVGMLLDPTSDDDQRDNVSFLSIVGIGGLGKTALAQLVFNDPRVTSAFSWTNWTCVADQDQKELDVKEVLCKILESQGSTMEQVQSQLREKLAGNKYLLVLDDVWTEKNFQWRDLVKYLMGGKKGSWIVVTTRSHKTVTIVDGEVYELHGLSKENSWSLFEQTAFTSNQSSNPPDELVEIGRKIVGGCAGVPLAIRVAGSLLYGQGKSKWQSVQEIGLANIRESENGILPILKLSFHHLESPLKSCFAYCALFPKDFEMKKDMLISLWMAHGYVVPLDKGQSIEDASEEYFSILLKRCFFQDIQKDDFGKFNLFKIHDLMHDIALDVAGEEILYATKTVTENLNKRVRHLSVANMGDHGNVLLKTHIRSHLHINYHIVADGQYIVKELVANCKWIRALDLCGLGIESLPDCIGRLLHLRYLDLSHNKYLQELPKSFSKLCNLQTLNLLYCESLRELPRDLGRLVKLRLLDVRGCRKLSYMPKDMGKLSNLHWLSHFMVGGGGSSSNWKQWFNSLEDLKTLNKLKGELNIQIEWPKKDKNNVKENDDTREGSYMRNKEHLYELRVNFVGNDGGKCEELSLMEGLQPHSNLKSLCVYEYKGVKMPGWLTLLTNIVMLHLFGCSELEYLPCLGSLCHLKSINLQHLENLEYIGVDEDPSCANNCSSTKMRMCGLGSCDKVYSFFPSLEFVTLWDLPKLKGWKRGQVEDNNTTGNNLQSQPLLPCVSLLRQLIIEKCPELTCLPSCLEFLHLIEFNKGLQIIDKKKRDEVASASSTSTSDFHTINSKLQKITIDNIAWLNSVPLEVFHSVFYLNIMGNKEEEEDDLPNWMQFLPALQILFTLILTF